MRTVVGSMIVSLGLVGLLSAQGARPGGAKDVVAKESVAAEALPKASDAGRGALAAARQVAARCRGLRGADRASALERAATAYDAVATDFAAEPNVAATAAFAAADLWRQQGSLPLAEKDYLRAVSIDAPRFGQRGLLGAADMQRRLKRADEAMATYAKAAAVDPGSSRAQDARLWQARLLQTGDRLDEAIAAFQAALESADPGNQTIEAANFLALAWVDKGDLDAAGHAIDHAVQSIADLNEEDPIVAERLHKSVEAMSARKALQRARDKANGAGKDAANFDAGQKKG
jgi:tetratricopeptide (TPR) repeat protein